jgi:primosomal protein N' (replication factor Y)
LILADSLLRFETLAREELDGLIPMHPINFRINFKGKIEISSREDNREKKFKIINDKNVTEVKDAIARKENIFIFSLRKGLATITTCKDCNETIFCKNCSAPLVLYLSRDGKKRMFVCNRCKKETSPETVCPRCGGWNLTPLGIGTDTVYDAVEKLFTKNTKPKIFKLDKGSIKSTKEAEKIIKEFEENPGGILIGTEMAFYYLKQKVPLSIIASFDSLWSVPNFRMSEKIVQIIMSITSIAKDKLIIQTKNIEDRAILAIKNENLASFIREELEDRNTLSYPPFKRFIKIRYLGDKAESLKIRVMLANIFKEYDPDIFSGFVAKEKNKYITNALIKIDTSKWSVPELSMGSTIDEELFKKLSALPFSFEVSVDPEDLL